MNAQFNERQGDFLKELGMRTAEDNALSVLEIAREIAREICRSKGVVNADDVGILMKSRHHVDTLGPAAGSLFRGKGWVFTGNWIKSKRVSNHSRMLREWRLAE